MPIERAAARVLVACIFVYGGRATLNDPAPRAQAAAGFLARLRRTVPGLPARDVVLVRVNAATQIAAGTLLAAGICDRQAAMVLAVSLVPTTLAGHAPWTAPDPAARSAEAIQMAKNAAILGALILLARIPRRQPRAS